MTSLARGSAETEGSVVVEDPSAIQAEGVVAVDDDPPIAAGGPGEVPGGPAAALPGNLVLGVGEDLLKDGLVPLADGLPSDDGALPGHVRGVVLVKAGDERGILLVLSAGPPPR